MRKRGEEWKRWRGEEGRVWVGEASQSKSSLAKVYERVFEKFSLGARAARRLQTTSQQDVRDCLIQRIDRRRLNSVVRPDVYSSTQRGDTYLLSMLHTTSFARSFSLSVAQVLAHSSSARYNLAYYVFSLIHFSIRLKLLTRQIESIDLPIFRLIYQRQQQSVMQSFDLTILFVFQSMIFRISAIAHLQCCCQLGPIFLSVVHRQD